jgi:hypothetical protein
MTSPLSLQATRHGATSPAGSEPPISSPELATGSSPITSIPIASPSTSTWAGRSAFLGRYRMRRTALLSAVKGSGSTRFRWRLIHEGSCNTQPSSADKRHRNTGYGLLAARALDPALPAGGRHWDEWNATQLIVDRLRAGFGAKSGGPRLPRRSQASSRRVPPYRLLPKRKA